MRLPSITVSNESKPLIKCEKKRKIRNWDEIGLTMFKKKYKETK